MNTVFSHRRPLAAYLVRENIDQIEAKRYAPEIWFVRARWFILGVAFAALIVAMVSV